MGRRIRLYALEWAERILFLDGTSERGSRKQAPDAIDCQTSDRQGGEAIHPPINPWADADLPPLSDTGLMTISDYLMNIALIALVILQIRGHKVTRARLVFPLVATVFVASQFLHAIPTAGNDLILIVGLAAVSAATLSFRCQSAQSNVTTPRMIVPAAWSS
jgi:hypothetical protein